MVIRLCTPVRDKTSPSAWIGFSFQDFTFTRDLETNVLLGKSPFLRKIRTEDLLEEWRVRKMAHENRDAHPLWCAPKCASPVEYTPPCLLSPSLSLPPRDCLSTPPPLSSSALSPTRATPGLWQRAPTLTHSVCARTVRVIVDRITVGTSARLLSLIKEQFHLSLSLSPHHPLPPAVVPTIPLIYSPQNFQIFCILKSLYATVSTSIFHIFSLFCSFFWWKEEWKVKKGSKCPVRGFAGCAVVLGALKEARITAETLVARVRVCVSTAYKLKSLVNVAEGD